MMRRGAPQLHAWDSSPTICTSCEWSKRCAPRALGRVRPAGVDSMSQRRRLPWDAVRRDGHLLPARSSSTSHSDPVLSTVPLPRAAVQPSVPACRAREQIASSSPIPARFAAHSMGAVSGGRAERGVGQVPAALAGPVLAAPAKKQRRDLTVVRNVVHATPASTWQLAQTQEGRQACVYISRALLLVPCLIPRCCARGGVLGSSGYPST